MTLPVVFTANGPSGYNLTNSLRFRSSASANLTRTPASAGNRKTWTWSVWVKRGILSTNQDIFDSANGSGTVRCFLRFNTANTLYFQFDAGTASITTTPLYRDPSAWYHIMLAVDSTQATSSNRLKLYVNGIQVTAGTFNYPSLNADSEWNISGQACAIGIASFYSGEQFDGYLTEVNFIDGQQLTPSSFGSTNALTGVWQPAKYTGTYGTNGFYLPFTDNSATTPVGLGKDFSGNSGTAIVGTTTSGSNSMTVVSLTGISVGNTVTGPGIPTGTYVTAASVLTVTLSQNATSSNVSQSYTFAGNNWFCNNISLTTGTTYDSMTDVPTLTSATTANYCVWNPLDKGSTSSFTFSDGNLKSANSDASNNYMGRATVAVSSGKWYWEVTLSAGTSAWAGGIATTTTGLSYGSLSSGSAYAYSNNGNSYNGQTGTSYGATYTAGDVIGVALDLNAGTLAFYKNGTSQGTAFTGISGTYAPAYLTNSSTVIANFGQQPFTYTPPTGFVALNTYNLPTSTIVKGNTVMDVNTYTGNGTGQSIVNSGAMKPDFVWIKSRSAAYNHGLVDTVRGINKHLYSNLTNAEGTCTAGKGITTINSNGFTLGTESDTAAPMNENGVTFVGWQWQAGQGTTSSNTSGSITSTVSVNATAGFSIVQFTATGSNATVGHGLGVAPAVVIVKDAASAGNWAMYNKNLTSAAYYLYLNTTAAQDNTAQIWNSTAPTSSVFSIGTWHTADRQIAYCWSEIAGFSKFGSYTGNASTDGPFIYTGFRPKYIMFKRSDSTGDWYVWDTVRNTYNAAGNALYPNYNIAEVDYGTGSGGIVDILSNGFKLRTNGVVGNSSGATYIYMAFAENPFKNALAR